MMPEKNQTLKIRKGTNNVRNVHILRTFPILHFLDVLKKKIGTSYVLDIV